MKNTIILPCDCLNEFQDKTYGKGLRVHNISQTKGKESPKLQASCTSCVPSAQMCKVLQVPYKTKTYDKPVNKKKEEPKKIIKPLSESVQKPTVPKSSKR